MFGGQVSLITPANVKLTSGAHIYVSRAYDMKKAVLPEDEDGAAMNLSLPWRTSDLVLGRVGKKEPSILCLGQPGGPRRSFQTRSLNTPTSESDQVVPLKSGISFPRGKVHQAILEQFFK
ncbi:hypothetical protein PIB30_090886 [Stylosanthes scabra]|uniref:Uncharacterized protein n=1 Tax=Stylosanthes scabra TaxID=79078 RepID=A0ABU6SVZ3_9FABA|nr:hypothetical protein [Stylosanthes scabra]